MKVLIINNVFQKVIKKNMCIQIFMRRKKYKFLSFYPYIDSCIGSIYFLFIFSFQKKNHQFLFFNCLFLLYAWQFNVFHVGLITETNYVFFNLRLLISSDLMTKTRFFFSLKVNAIRGRLITIYLQSILIYLDLE